MKHVEQAIGLLKTQINNKNEVDEIYETAKAVSKKWVQPLSGGKAEINGLIYGLIQSGKTGVLTTTGAFGADEGYRTILILTSNIDPLYKQTLDRVKEAFPGMDIIGKQDLKDLGGFIDRIKSHTCAIVTPKNGNHLRTLVENFKHAKVKGLTCLIIDDEADQASLNTRESKADKTRSAINELISKLREFFEKNTYLQVTATPQALFLQTPIHDFRPKFTILSHPGADYVGGDHFFGEDSQLVREFDINDISLLATGNQPRPNREMPNSLITALDTFMIAATYKRSKSANENCAFLCHVSTRKDDHSHIESLLRWYKTDLPAKLKAGNAAVRSRLQRAYDDLSSTDEGIRSVSLDELIEAIQFFSPGINVKLVNADTDEDVAVKSPYNLFVGGNKLGRGVTIKNLLVSYYGRNPQRPQADTVLQHARMYGYRSKDKGLLRLFLPHELHVVFQAIHQMENGLRELIEKESSEKFRGLYVEGNLNPTRKNVLAPGAVGIYSAGKSYNPAQVLRNPEGLKTSQKIDSMVQEVQSQTFKEFEINKIAELVTLCKPNPEFSEKLWNTFVIAASIKSLAEVSPATSGYVYIDRDRDLKEKRRESAGILTGGEASRVPTDKVTLFMLKTKDGFWWPQVRFPSGHFAFAFSI